MQEKAGTKLKLVNFPAVESIIEGDFMAGAAILRIIDTVYRCKGERR